MSDTLNRPMFKRGPDGRMREAHFWGGLAGLPTMWRQAKVFAPKFSNVPHYWNKGMQKLGVPKVTRDGFKFGTAQRTTKPIDYSSAVVGKDGPRNYSVVDDAFDARMQGWHSRRIALENKHNARGIGFKFMPEELKQHYRARPKMPTGRKRVEQIGYGLGVPALYGWGPGYPDDPEANTAADGGASTQETPTEGTVGVGVEEQINTGIAEEGGSPVPSYPTKVEMDEDPESSQGIDYDGASAEGSDRQPGLFGSQDASDMADITNEAIIADDSISMEGVNKYKDELRAIIGEEDKTTGSLILMQLGLGMMAGRSDQPGFAGFAEILGKTGQQVLPMWMEHMKDKRKEDKEIGLAAYEMLREDRAAVRKRQTDLTDWVWKEDYKNMMNPPGVLSNILVKKSVPLPGGGFDESWEILKQTYSKSPEALQIMNSMDPNYRVVPLNITDAGMIAGGFGSNVGDFTKSQRGEHANLAVTLEKNIPQILNFLMDPKMGLHSGNFKTGGTGSVVKGLRFITREVQQALDAIGVKSPIMGDMAKSLYGTLGQSQAMQLDALVTSGGIMPGAGNQMSSEHAGTGINDIWYGPAEGPNGQMMEGEFATEQYVRNLTDNSLYDIEEQLTNMMGFLEARLKQPTGRLLADTIRSSIKAQQPLGLGAGDPVQVANKMHFFVKRLYEAYARHAAIGGRKVQTEWQGISGPMSIFDYEKQYQGFVGDQRSDPPIDFSFMGDQQTLNVEGPGNIYGGQNQVVISGPQNFDNLVEKYTQ